VYNNTSPHTFGNDSCIFHVKILTLKLLSGVRAAGFPFGSGVRGGSGSGRSNCTERGVFFLDVVLVDAGVFGSSP
jgi:hypothetical protein